LIVKALERIIFVAGLALFVGLLYKIGPGSLLRDLSLVGAGFAFILGQELLAFLFNTFGWRYTIQPRPRRVALRDLLAMRIAGDAINYVTPSATIGGELVKGRLLQRRIPAAEAVSSVSLAVINQFLSRIIFVLASVPFFAKQILAQAAAPLTFGVCGFVVIVCAALFYLSWRQDFFQRAHAFVVRQGWLSQWTANVDVWRKLDENIFGSYWRYPRDHALSVLFFALGWSMGAVEIRLILYFLHVPAGWATAVAIEALSILVDQAFFYVPAKIGTQEGGKYFIFLLLGLSPVSGFALGVVRRLREIAWVFVGLLIFAYYHYISRHGSTPLMAEPRRVPILRSGDLQR
jgi:uncharacterized protein (TIRG00374 family)